MEPIARICVERDLLFQWLVDQLLKHGQETREEAELFVNRSLREVIDELN
jgi:hypothetical protein